MYLKTIQQLKSSVLLFLFMALMAASCSNNNEETGGSSAVGVVTGTYQATITPTMGTKQMAQGPHIIVLEALNNNQQVRFHFEKFNAPMFDSNGKIERNSTHAFCRFG